MWIGIYETETRGEFKNQGFYVQHYDWCYPEHDGPVIATSAKKEEVVAKCREYMKTHRIKAPDYNWGLSFCKGYDEWYRNWWPGCPDYSQTDTFTCPFCGKEFHTWDAGGMEGLDGWCCNECSHDYELRDKLQKKKERMDCMERDFCK